MVKKFLFSLLVILLVASSLVSFGESDTRPLIIDDAGLFSDDEILSLEEMISFIEDKHNINMIVVTSDKLGENSSEDYVDSIYEEFVGLGEDGTCMLIDMKNSYVYITSYGNLVSVIGDKEIDDTLDAAIDGGLASGEYSKGVSAYIVKIDNLCSGVAETANTPEEESDGRPRVIDDAMLFSEEEALELSELAKALEKKHNIHIIIATTDDVGGKSSEAYIDDLYGQVIGDDVDGTGILIDMDNRQVHITTAGSAIPVMDDDRIDDTLDAVIADGLKSEEYALGIKSYISMVDDFFVKGPKDNNIIKPREERKYDLFDAALSSVVSLISGFRIKA